MLPLRKVRKRRAPVVVDSEGEYTITLTGAEINALKFACAYTILSDRRRTDQPVSTERRVDNAIDDVNDVSQKLTKLTRK